MARNANCLTRFEQVEALRSWCRETRSSLRSEIASYDEGCVYGFDVVDLGPHPAGAAVRDAANFLADLGNFDLAEQLVDAARHGGREEAAISWLMRVEKWCADELEHQGETTGSSGVGIQGRAFRSTAGRNRLEQLREQLTGMDPVDWWLILEWSTSMRLFLRQFFPEYLDEFTDLMKAPQWARTRVQYLDAPERADKAGRVSVENQKRVRNKQLRLIAFVNELIWQMDHIRSPKIP